MRLGNFLAQALTFFLHFRCSIGIINGEEILVLLGNRIAGITLCCSLTGGAGDIVQQTGCQIQTLGSGAAGPCRVFIFQTETVSLQPADAYQNKGMAHDTFVGEYMNNRSKNGTRGYCVLENIWRSVMAGFTAEEANGKPGNMDWWSAYGYMTGTARYC